MATARHLTFRFRLTGAEAERLTREARERRITKADLIRTALGWERVEVAPREAPPLPDLPSPEDQRAAPAPKIGLAATVDQLAERLKQ